MGHYGTLQEYLLYQPFLVRTDNNPLTYIMTTPNLVATGHHWVGTLARINFLLEYQKGWGNTILDAVSLITTRLSPKAVQSILDGVTLGMAHRAEGHDPSMVEGDHDIEKGGMCHHRVSTSQDVCYKWGCSSERRHSSKCSAELVRGPEED